jgi:hypothetical protein
MAIEVFKIKELDHRLSQNFNFIATERKGGYVTN